MNSSPPPGPHDLLWLDPQRAWLNNPSLPDWLGRSWHAGLPVVVRRDRADAQWLAVGIRGPQRQQRHALWVERAAVRRILRPECIARQAAWQRHPHYPRLPALQALQQLHGVLDELAYCWGVIGSAGFTLGSQHPALGPDSDLDLLLRTPQPPERSSMQYFAKQLARQGCRVDVQLDTPAGGVALTEWLRGDTVLVKTARGPCMMADPWSVRTLP